MNLESKSLGHKYSHDDVDCSLSALEEARDALLPILLDWYNDHFELKHDLEYYRRVLGPFLVVYLPTIFDLWRYPDSGAVDSVGDKVIPLEPADFAHLVRSSVRFHSQICADLVSSNCSDGVSERTVWNCKRPMKAAKQRLLQSLEAFPGKIIRPSVMHFLTPTCRGDRLALACATRFRFGPTGNFDSPTDLKVDADLRSKLSQAMDDDIVSSLGAFAKVALRLLANYLPASLLEDFGVTQRLMKHSCQQHRPQTILTGYGLLTSARFSIWASECSSRGTKLIGWQHGGTYGEAAPTSSETLERSIVDRFWTWGWDDGREGTIAVPCPRQSLVPKPNQVALSGTGLLWVTTSDSRRVYAIHHHRFGRRFEDYFEHQRRLYDALPLEIQKQITVRRYKECFEHAGEDHWDRPNLAASIKPSNRSLVDQAKASELTIIDHCGATSLLECMLADVPTILVGPVTYFRPRPSAKQVFEGLVNASIQHESIESARSFLVENHHQYLQWWQDAQTRQSRNAFVEMFCRADPNYRRRWIDAIEAG